MADNTLNATLRTEFGKGAARRTRRAGLVPAVLYGHGSDPVHLSLPGHDTFLIIRHSRNAVIELSFDGKRELALVKDVQISSCASESVALALCHEAAMALCPASFTRGLRGE